MAKIDEAAAKAAQFDFDKNDTMEGFEQIDGSTISIPFIRILQKLSPQLDKQKPEYIEGAEEGQVFNTTTRDVYGNEFRCIVLRFEHIYIEWKPNRGGFVKYHSVENAERLAEDTSVFGNWRVNDPTKKPEERNILQENYVYMILVEGHENEGPVVLSLASSMLKTAKVWNRLMTTHVMENGEKARPYYLIWRMKTEYKKNDKGTWYTPNVFFDSYVNAVQYAMTKQERLALPAAKIDYSRGLEAPNPEGDVLSDAEIDAGKF
jgi:hypothetical protein